MTGRAEVARLQSRLDATFKRGSELSIHVSDLETQSDFARYLCVLVAGFLEKAIAELVLEHSRKTGAPTLQSFVEANTKRFTNANSQKIADLLGSFSPDWRLKMKSILTDEFKDAVDSVIGLRHLIAHGGSAGVTYGRMNEYYLRIQLVIDEIADLCAPVK
jgi:hypothetical protein